MACGCNKKMINNDGATITMQAISPCYYCCRKHLGRARGLLNEWWYYPENLGAAIGEISLAEDHIFGMFPEFAGKLRTARIAMDALPPVLPDLDEFLRELHGLSTAVPQPIKIPITPPASVPSVLPFALPPSTLNPVAPSSAPSVLSAPQALAAPAAWSVPPVSSWISARLARLDELGIDWRESQSELELRAWLPWLKARQPKSILEIGVNRGGHFFMLAGCLAPGGTIQGVDYRSNYGEQRELVMRELAGAGITASVDQFNSDELDKRYAGRKFDGIYIDGGHTYPRAKSDWEKCLLLLAPGGFIGFHDVNSCYGRPGWVNTLWTEIKTSGKYKTTEYFKHDKKWGVGIVEFFTSVLPDFPFVPGARSVSAPRILFIINGGLGDGVSAVYAIKASINLGYTVDVLSIAGGCTQLAAIWPLLGAETVDRSAAIGRDYYAILCPTGMGTLQERAAGFKYKHLINGHPTPSDTIVGRWMRLVTDLLAVNSVNSVNNVTPVIPEIAPLAFLKPAPIVQYDSAGKEIPSPKPYVIAPGVGRAPECEKKLWDRWPDLIRYIPRPVVFVGDNKANFPWIENYAGQKEFTSLIGKTPGITDLIAALAPAIAVITVDGGIGHLAAALGIQTVSIFTGATDSVRFRPFGPLALVHDLTKDGTETGRVANLLHTAIAAKCGHRTAPAIISQRKLSLIITAHNEGDEVLLTCEDALERAGCQLEVIVVDDASTDGSCDHLPAPVKVIRRSERVGVASSRNLGVLAATGEVLTFWDGHMRAAAGTLDTLADAAMSEKDDAIFFPGMKPLYHPTREPLQLCRWKFDNGRLHTVWTRSLTKAPFADTPGFVAPGWALTRRTWDRLGPWPDALRGWGSTEVCKSIQAWLCGVRVIAMRDAVVYHRFRGAIPYSVSHGEVMTNAWLVARILFDQETFQNVLMPAMKPVYWNDTVAALLDSSEVSLAAADFAKRRTRSGSDFMTAYFPLGLTPPPPIIAAQPGDQIIA